MQSNIPLRFGKRSAPSPDHRSAVVSLSPKQPGEGWVGETQLSTNSGSGGSGGLGFDVGALVKRDGASVKVTGEACPPFTATWATPLPRLELTSIAEHAREILRAVEDADDAARRGIEGNHKRPRDDEIQLEIGREHPRGDDRKRVRRQYPRSAVPIARRFGAR